MKRPTTAPPLYAQDGKGHEATVHAHYFIGSSDWLITEYDPDQDLAFGWARLNGDDQNAELGYVSLTELEDVAVPLTINGTVIPHAVTVEYDEGWEPVTLTRAIALLNARQGRV